MNYQWYPSPPTRDISDITRFGIVGIGPRFVGIVSPGHLCPVPQRKVLGMKVK